MLKTLLVAVDGSDNATRALDYAVELAKTFQSKLIILSVYKHYSVLQSTHSLTPSWYTPDSPDETLGKLAREVVDASAERAREHGAAEIKTVVRRGPTSRTIVEEAKKQKADTVILGSRGLGDVGGFLLGSVSHKVAGLAPCTCITVK